MLAQMALMVFMGDLLRYLVTAGIVWLTVNVLLRKRLYRRRILEAAITVGQIRREVTYSLSTVTIFAAIGLLLWLLIESGKVEVYADLERRGLAWWCASLVLIILAHDTWFYWTHRALHHRLLFRTIHARHHTSRHPTPWAAYAFHPVEALVQASFVPLFVAAVPVHMGVLAVFLLHMIVRNAVGHCAHELFPWHWTPRGWLCWITPVSHHHFHHARNVGNYGLYFTWWDRLCRTEDVAYLQWGDAHLAAQRRHEASA